VLAMTSIQSSAMLNLLPGSKNDPSLEVLQVEGDFVTCTQ